MSRLLAETILAFGWTTRASLYFDLTEKAQGGLVRSWLPGVGHIRS